MRRAWHTVGKSKQRLGYEMSQNLVTAAATQAMDDTADWAVKNVVHLMPATEVLAWGARDLAAARMTANQARKLALLQRVVFLRAEAALMLDEQWQLFGTEQLMQDSYRASRKNPRDVSACLSCWAEWDADGHKLYQALMHRAACIEAEAKAVAL